MAFSFRAGTNWCHDFPKLARESGFYFNMHKTRVRIDWNRICSIDIEQVIQESDFQTVDDNVNNVIDYSFENEYDVKILDPNFVKLFRLAQLAIEYLLYCKQYLDQSVVILKDELKLKIEENVKLKKEVSTLNEAFKDFKEKSRMMDMRFSDPHGEIHKCPFCPKSFISAMFTNAHINRRHSSSSSAPEEYKSETEKLHNEIKTLKERLNQTEKVINESNKWNNSSNIVKADKAENTEESSFKNKDEKLSEQNSKYAEDSAMMINEMKLRMENDIESVQVKLLTQENYWITKMGELESQHRKDIENLFSQLQLTQESATHMKSEYELKIKDLEKQSLNQSEMISAQSERLNSLSRGIQDSQLLNHEKNKESSQKVNGFVTSLKKTHEGEKLIKSSEEISDSTLLETSSISSPQSVKLIPLHYINNRQKLEHKFEKSKKVLNGHKKSDEVDNRGNRYPNEFQGEKNGVEMKESFDDEEDTSVTETEDSELSSESKTETETSETVTEIPADEIYRRRDDCKRTNLRLKDMKEDLKEIFYKKMQNVGIDPDWEGIPKATYKQKVGILKHHQSINAKKFTKYDHIREKLLIEVSRKLTIKQKEPKQDEPTKKTFLNKMVGNVKMKAMKALNIQKSSGSTQKSTTLPRRTESKKSVNSNIFPKKLSLEDFTLKKSVEAHFDDRPEESNVVETPVKMSVSSATSKQDRYETIEDFKRGSQALDMTSAKVTSTPKKNTNNILQQSYSEIDDQLSNLEATRNLLMSPKSNNKSVLKGTSTVGSASGSIRKKVEFNLEKDNSPVRESMRAKSFGEVSVHDVDKRDVNDSDWNISSISDEKHCTVRQSHQFMNDVPLKTQNQRMEQITRTTQDQVTVIRRKVSSASESTLLSSPLRTQNEMYENVSNFKSPPIEQSSQLNEKNIQAPQAAPRNLKKNDSVQKSVPETKDSDLEKDINDIMHSD